MSNDIPYVINHSFLDDKPEQIGKYTKVWIDKFSIDKGTMNQIKTMILHPSVDNARIMPDCHRGKGCCIGFTSKLTDKVVPNYIGGDIGCGIISYNTDIKLDKLLEYGTLSQFEKYIQDNIYLGTSDRNIYQSRIVTDEELNSLYINADDEAYNFIHSYNLKFKENLNERVPDYNLEWFQNTCQKVQVNFDYVLRSVGTLGGGNHFIEVNKDSNDNIYITIHTGSRGFGQAICSYHQNKINDEKHLDYDKLDEYRKNLSRKVKDHKMFKLFFDSYKNEMIESRHPDYL